MKDWILNFIVEMILKAITDDKIEDLAEKVKSFLIPFMQDQKNELLAALMAKAAQTDTEIDDAVYHALGVFLDAFIPSEEAVQNLCK